MNTLMKMITLIVFLNIFLYIGLNFVKSTDGYYMNQELKFYWKGDLVESLMNNQVSLENVAASTRDNYTDYDLNFSSDFTTVPSQYGGSSAGGTASISFLDSLKIAWAIIPTLFNIAVSPLTIFFNFRMPIFFGLMLGVPYFVILTFSIFLFIRGVGD